MSKPLLIGLTGDCGRDQKATADLLSLYGYSALSLEGPVIDGITAMLGIELDDLSDMREKNMCLPGFNVTVNEAIRKLTVNWGAEGIGQNIWLNRLEDRLVSKLNNNVPVVVFDIKRDNEAEFIRSHGGIVWSIDSLLPDFILDGAEPVRVSSHLVDKIIPYHSTTEALSKIILFELSAGELFTSSFDIDDFKLIACGHGEHHRDTNKIDRMARELLGDFPSQFSRRIGRLAALLFCYRHFGHDAEITNDAAVYIACAQQGARPDEFDLQNTVSMVNLCCMFIESLDQPSQNTVINWGLDVMGLPGDRHQVFAA